MERWLFEKNCGTMLKYVNLRLHAAQVLDLFTRANIAENDPTIKFLVPQK